MSAEITELDVIQKMDRDKNLSELILSSMKPSGYKGDFAYGHPLP